MMDRYSIATTTSAGRMTARAMPFGIPDGRPGSVITISDAGELKRISYAATVYERGAFSEFLAAGGAQRVQFMFQHGDIGQGWIDAPMGTNALPIGRVDALREEPDGLYVDVTFASHDLATAVRELVEMGALTEMSVSLVPVAYEFRSEPDDPATLYRHVTRADLYDVSVVVWGQFGQDATVTEIYRRAPDARRLLNPDVHALRKSITALLERYAGAAISAANADVIRSAATDLRAAADTLIGHADALEALPGVKAEEDDSDAAVNAMDARGAELDERIFSVRLGLLEL